MDILEKEISDLKVEIDGYKTDFKGATTEKENDRLSGLLTSAGEVLKLLLVGKNAQQTAGTIIYCSTLPLNFISITSMLLIYLSSFDYFLMFSKLHCIYLQFLENDCVVLNSILFLFPAIFSPAIILR
jgi:hypothetical protein